MKTLKFTGIDASTAPLLQSHGAWELVNIPRSSLDYSPGEEPYGFYGARIHDYNLQACFLFFETNGILFHCETKYHKYYNLYFYTFGGSFPKRRD